MYEIYKMLQIQDFPLHDVPYEAVGGLHNVQDWKAFSLDGFPGWFRVIIVSASPAYNVDQYHLVSFIVAPMKQSAI